MEVGNCKSPYIPDDLLYQIFQRLPAKSLLRLRCVSKLWCNIIDSVSFASLQLSTMAGAESDETQILPLPFIKVPNTLPSLIYDVNAIKESGYPILELSFSEDVRKVNRIYHFAYGLLCFKNRGGRTFLCNPLRGEVLELPYVFNPNKCLEWYGMGFDNTTNTYKVIRVQVALNKINELSSGFSHSITTEVYTLGTSSWRPTSSVPYGSLSAKGVSAYGDMYWMNSHYFSRKRSADESMITSFDFKKEQFKRIPHPDFGGYKSHENYMLVDMRGSLAILKFSYAPSATDNIEIWRLIDYDKKEWVREYKISNHDIKERIVFGVYGLYFYTHPHDNIYLLDLKKNCIWNMQRPGNQKFDGVILGFRGNVLSLKNFGNCFKVAEDQSYNFLKITGLVYISP